MQDLRNLNVTTAGKPPTRQIYSGEIFHDASCDYDINDDDDEAIDGYEQVFSPTVENGVTVMKARFQKRYARLCKRF